MPKVISFYPGPSRIDSKVPKYIKEAYSNGILSMNHRSDAFMSLVKANDRILKDKLDIPKEYRVYYVSSATECWELISQSLTGKPGSFHIYNGAFGKKWYEYAGSITGGAESHKFDVQESLKVPNIQPKKSAIICLTQNETANGTQIKNSILDEIRNSFPENLIAVDATSSMAGIHLNFRLADIWFASVQKCFGLPSGMAVLICSPRAVEKALEINEQDHYNSLFFIEKNMKKWQTTHTPNILGIYLLNRVMKARKPILKTDKKLVIQMLTWCKFLEDSEKLKCFIKKSELRSDTVLTLKGEPSFIKMIKSQAEKKDLVLGNGYGELSDTTIRIANFPAIKKKEIKYLREFLYPLI